MSTSGTSATDPANDVPFATGDLTAVTASYGTSIVLTAQTAAPSDPTTDDRWVVGSSDLFWTLDTRGDATPEYGVDYYSDGIDQIVVDVVQLSTNTVLCSGTGTHPTGTSFRAAFAASCLGSPPGFAAHADLTWDENAVGDPACGSCSLDRAPNSSYLPWVIPPTAAVAGSTFTPVATSRIYDHAIGTTSTAISVTGLGGVPPDATAVAVNVEVTGPTAAGYLRVTPFGQDAPVATQEFAARQAISNLVVIKVVNGKIQARLSAGSARVLLDIAGYYSSSTTGSSFTPLASTRIYDHTIGTAITPIPVAGLAGVPTDATAVIVNVEVAAPTASGYLRVTPYTADAAVAVQEFTAGQSISNLVAVKLVAGKIQAKLSVGSGRVLVDVAGYYSGSTAGSTFTPLAAARLFDHAVGTAITPVSVTGVAGIPADATAVVINVEVASPTSAGYLRVTPYTADAPVATQEFSAGRTISNLVVVKVINGRVQLKLSAGSARVLVDVAGYYS